MDKRYIKAIAAGIFTIFIVILVEIAVIAAILFVFKVFLPLFFILGLILVASMGFAGLLAAFWTAGDVSSPKETLMVSAVAGLAPTLLMTLAFVVLMVFFSLTLTDVEFSMTYEVLVTLISLACGAVIVLFGTVFAVMGGYLHLFIKDKYRSMARNKI